MIIKLVHDLGELVLSTKAGKVNINADPPDLLDILESEVTTALSKSYGVYGHTFDIQNTTHEDLYAACLTLVDFKVKSVSKVPKLAKVDARQQT